MCWTGPISILMAAIGFSVAGYLAYKKWSKLLWIPIAYFGLMELLQAFTYFTLGSCTPTNQILTFLSYLHISFQPFFINAFFLFFIPKNFRKKIIGWVFGLCFIATILMITRLYPFEWANSCAIGEVLCGESLCAVSGNFHIAWEIPFSAFSGIIGFIASWAYMIAIFLLPLIYGAWKLAGLHLMIGPVLSYALTKNPNEWPTVWCLFSIAIILIVFIPRLMRWLRVKKWYFWEYPK